MSEFPGVELVAHRDEPRLRRGQQRRHAPRARARRRLRARAEQRRRGRPGLRARAGRGGGPPPRRRRRSAQDPLRRPDRPDLVRRRELRPALRLQRPPARLPRARRRPLRRGGRDRPRLRRRDARPARACSRRSASSIRELFFYSEDTDWSLRAREAGYRHYVVPASTLWHKVSATSGGESSPTTLYYGIRNTIAVCERHAPLGRLGTWRRRLDPARRPPRRRRCSRAASARASPRSSQGWRDVRARPFRAEAVERRMARVTAQQAKQVVKNALYRTIGETSTALRLRPGRPEDAEHPDVPQGQRLSRTTRRRCRSRCSTSSSAASASSATTSSTSTPCSTTTRSASRCPRRRC